MDIGRLDDQPLTEVSEQPARGWRNRVLVAGNEKPMQTPSSAAREQAGDERIGCAEGRAVQRARC